MSFLLTVRNLRAPGAFLIALVSLAPGSAHALCAIGNISAPVTDGATPTPAAVSDATGEKPESKLWFERGLWWATMWNTAQSRYEIFRLDPNTNPTAWTSTNIPIPGAADTRFDALWDPLAGGRLYIVSHTRAITGANNVDVSGPCSPACPIRLRRFTPTTVCSTASTTTCTSSGQCPAGETCVPGYTEDTAAVTPSPTIHNDTVITVGALPNNLAMETLVVAKGTNGYLWATWTTGGHVWVSHTTGPCAATASNPPSTNITADCDWIAQPVDLTSASLAAADDISSIVAFNEPSVGAAIGVMYSKETAATMYFAYRTETVVGVPDSTPWTQEAAFGGPNPSKNNGADDHINLKVSTDNRVFAAVKTSRDTRRDGGGQVLGAPLVHLLVRGSCVPNSCPNNPGASCCAGKPGVLCSTNADCGVKCTRPVGDNTCGSGHGTCVGTGNPCGCEADCPTATPWTSYLFGAEGDAHTRPIVLLDETNQCVHIIATSSVQKCLLNNVDLGPQCCKNESDCPNPNTCVDSNGLSQGTSCTKDSDCSSNRCGIPCASGTCNSHQAIVEKVIPLDNTQAFDQSNQGLRILSTTTDSFNNATSFKQNLNPSQTPLVILASEDASDNLPSGQTRTYWHFVETINCSDDGNPCTDDVYQTSVGADGTSQGTTCHSPKPAGTPCPDEGNPCTADSCNSTGSCTHSPLTDGTACPDDGNSCTLDKCNGGGTCTHPAKPDGTACADEGNGCTTDTCSNGTCAHTCALMNSCGTCDANRCMVVSNVCGCAGVGICPAGQWLSLSQTNGILYWLAVGGSACGSFGPTAICDAYSFPGPTGQFALTGVPNTEYVAVQNRASGLYWSVDPGDPLGVVHGNMNSIGLNENFLVIHNADGTISLRVASTGKYVIHYGGVLFSFYTTPAGPQFDSFNIDCRP